MEYEYAKVIAFGEVCEVYRYEKRPRNNLRRRGVRTDSKRAVESALGVSFVSDGGGDIGFIEEQARVRQKRSARRAVLAFRRLVASNLGGAENPVLVTLTYGENMGDIRQARADFNSFGRNVAREFGKGIRLISVAEFQQRGAVHFHALAWGLPSGTVERERSTRLVASLWGKGFVYLKETDGNVKLSSYLAKYMVKAIDDPRLFGMKSYVATRNVRRPVVYKDAVLSLFFVGGMQDIPDLSTDQVLREAEYMTQWLGRANYKRYLVTDYGNRNDSESNT